MNTKFKHRILTGALLTAALFAGTSCDDSEGLKVTGEVPFADKTLYEVLLSDAELSDFVEVVNSCGEHCADSLFNKSKVYTLWAPVNGTFNKDSLIAEVENGNREMVFQSFVKAHISNHLRAANGTLGDDNKVLLLNEKIAVFKGDRKNGYSFSGQHLAECNIRVWNGLLHKLEAPSEYKYNIMEYLELDENVDSVSKFIYSYNVTEFSAGQSIMGPIVGGEQTYLDSVFVTSNKLLSHWNGVGFLDSEDSTYTVYVPNNKAWADFVAESDKYFNFNLESANPKSVNAHDRDSLRNYYARINALKYMTFSNNEQVYVNNPDSILPIWQSGAKREELDKQQLEACVLYEKELSNGTFKVIDKCPFTTYDLFHDTIKIEGENAAMRKELNGTVAYSREAPKNKINDKDSLFKNAEISGNYYYEGMLNDGNGRASVSFKLPNALSAKYNLAIITVPKNITNPDVQPAQIKPTTYTAKVYMQNDSKNVIFTGTANALKDRVDTLFFKDANGERVVLDIPYCEYYNTGNYDDYNLIMELTAGLANQFVLFYDFNVRIDAIMLVPAREPEE